MRNLSETVRKVAILITSIDERTADELLEQLPGEISAKVRRAVVELEVVDRAEQQRVIEEFIVHSGGSFSETSLPADEGVELAPELERKLSVSGPGIASSVRTACRPQAWAPEQTHFPFLRRSAAPEIAQILERQHPQVVAVVLSHLPPELSSEILTRLPTDLQLTVLRRIADSQHTEPEILRDLEHQLQRQFMPPTDTSTRAPGLETVRAILAVARERGNTKWLEHLQNTGGNLVTQFGLVAPETTRDMDVSMAPSTSASEQSLANSSSIPFIVPRRRVGPPTEWQFSDIMALSHDELARLFQAVEPRILLAALAGAEGNFVNRILGQLPPDEAHRLKQKLTEAKSWEPREIEEGQRQLALKASLLFVRSGLSPRKHAASARAA